jgi:hypothetical protein
VVGVAAAALIATAFVLGRVTSDSSGRSIPDVRTVVVQQHPAGPPAQNCHVYKPC